MREEVNIDFRPTRLFKTGKYKDRELFRFLGDWSGNPDDIKMQAEEISEYCFFSYKEAIKLKLGFEYREVIELLRQEKLL